MDTSISIPIPLLFKHAEKLYDIDTIINLMRVNKDCYYYSNIYKSTIIQKTFETYKHIIKIDITINNTLFKLKNLKNILDIYSQSSNENIMPFIKKMPELFNKNAIVITTDQVSNTLKVLLNTMDYINTANNTTNGCENTRKIYQMIWLIYIYELIEFILIQRKLEDFVKSAHFINTISRKGVEITNDLSILFKKNNMEPTFRYAYHKCIRFIRNVCRNIRKIKQKYN